MTAPRVVIVGGGPVGLLSACLLARYGVECTLLEQNAQCSEMGKAGGISTRSIEIFEVAGIVNEVLAAAIRLDRVDVVERRSGKVLLRFPLERLASDTAYPLQVHILQSDLEPIILAGARRFGADVRFNHRVTSFSQDDDACYLTVETPRGAETMQADYVLACEGAHSVVRRGLGISLEGTTWPERIVIIELQPEFTDEGPPYESDLSYVVDPHEWLILVRQPALWRVLYPIPVDAQEPDRAEAERRVRLAMPDIVDTRISKWETYRIHQRVAARFREGRAFLLGDSAHLITPMGGLGLNTGLEDALNLAWKLAWVVRHGADERILASYDSERRPVAARIAARMVMSNREQMSMRNPVRRALRNLAFGVVQRSERLMWDQLYRRSLLAVSYAPPPNRSRLARLRPQVRPPLRVGDRVYDGILMSPEGGPRRLFDLLGNAFTALTFADARRPVNVVRAPWEGFRHVIASRFDAPRVAPWRDATYLDVGGQLASRFGASVGTTYLIRPDHFVGAIAHADGPPPDLLYQQALAWDTLRASPADAPLAEGASASAAR